MLKTNRIKVSGSALLTALFIMTLVAIVATAMSTRLQLDIYRSRLLLTHDKMLSASEALTFWAMNELNNPKHQFTRINKQGMIAEYPTSMATTTPGIQIKGGLYDLQGLYNLNNLVEKKAMPSFVALMNETMPTASNDEKIDLLFYLKDWLLPYDIAKGKDAYFAYYLAQKPPYFPANLRLQSISELRLIRGYTAAIVTRLSPFVTALPESTEININSASSKVLMTLGPGLKAQQANDLITARGSKGIKKLNELEELLQKLNIPSEQLTTESHYFLSIAHVRFDEFHMVVTTRYIRRRNQQGKVSVRLVRMQVSSE
jgi:general secretion pathway protein K